MVKYKLIIASFGLMSTAIISGCADDNTEPKTPEEKAKAITEECSTYNYDKEEDSYECTDKESGHSGMFLFMGNPFSSRADMQKSPVYKEVTTAKGKTLNKTDSKATGKVTGGKSVSGSKATAMKSNSAFKTGLGTSGAKGGG